MDRKQQALIELGRLFSGIGIGMALANMTLVPRGDNRGYVFGGILMVLGLLISELNIPRDT